MTSERKLSTRGAFSRRFTSFDILVLIIGAALGFAGNAIFSGDTPILIGLGTLATLAAVATLAVDRLRAHAQWELSRTASDLQTRVHEQHNALEQRLQRHLNQVHATVDFVPDSHVANHGSRARLGYDAAEAAVRRADRRIYVIGDYSPPKEYGAELDSNDPPNNRGAYFRAIEEMLRKRLETEDNLPVLEYRRFIQRPVNLYSQIATRETPRPGISLRKTDMLGDLQAFDHCARVLQIAAAAAKGKSARIAVDLRLIPFLPNCPSVLIVDDHDVQFTIPTRIDRPGDDFATQGLLGVLAMQDRQRGSVICWPFVELFQRLAKFSVPIIRIEGSDVPGVEVEPVPPPEIDLRAGNHTP